MDIQDQTPSSAKADPRDMFSSLLIVGRLEEVSMLTDPPRLALSLYVAGHEWEEHSFHIARLHLFHQPAQLDFTYTSLHSAAMAFVSSTNETSQVSGRSLLNPACRFSSPKAFQQEATDKIFSDVLLRTARPSSKK